jgi:nickel-dependent lactate racemase
MKTFALPYGKTHQDISLPEEHVLYDIHGNGGAVVKDVQAATREALAHPLDSKPLAQLVHKGDKVALVVSDITRLVHTAEFLPEVVAELNQAGIADADMTIVVATGTHRAQTPAEDAVVCGADLARRIKIHQHDCRNQAELKYYGTTKHGTPVYLDTVVADADKVIVTGGISLHPFAGFGGGRKAILPGVAGLESINHNHLMALADQVGAGCEKSTETAILTGNRIAEDMDEACAMLNPTFLVNVVFTPEGELHEIVAGNWRTAFDKGSRDLLKLAGVHIKDRADVVIASAGGYPKDLNLYQAMKSHMNAIFAVKPGGIMIQTLECPDIKEPAVFTDWLVKSEPLQFEKEVRADFSIPAFVAFKSRQIINSLTVYLVTRPENFAFVKSSGQIPVASLAEAWELAQKQLAERQIKDYKVTIMTHAAATLPMLED